MPPSGPQSLRIQRVIVYPLSVAPGEKATIYVTVEDQSGQKVQGATVLIELGGGKFLDSEKSNYDPKAVLQGPFSTSGFTALNGVYTAWWVCNGCANGYVMNVKASKGGVY